MGEFRYKAFISYSWADKEWGAWLHRALETYRTPGALAGTEGRHGPVPASLHPIFKDREEESAGASIGASIEAAMASSEFLIVLCSPRSAQSKWVRREVAWFKTHRDPAKILALIVDGEPMASEKPGREAEECFPPTLLFRVGPDLAPTAFAEDAPLAADARESGDGKRGAKLKLAAAMLGLGLDDLVRRDERRRTVRRRFVTGAALGVAAVFAFLAFDALRARDAALVARNEAVTAQKAAEAAEKDAKFQAEEAQNLVEFMLTDFRQELNSLGRLDVLERTGKRLLESFAKQDVAKLDANALGRRARVLLLLGEVDNTRGNLDAALARYKEAAATTGELLRRNPESAQQIFDHAQSVFWVGYIAWQRGDAATAKAQFTEYHDYAQKLVAIDPGKDEWQMEVGYALNNLGTLAMDQGEAAEAEAYFRKWLDLSKRMLESGPDDIVWIGQVGQSQAWLADALHRQSKLAAAMELRAQEIRHYEAWLAIQAANAEVAQAMAVALYRLSQTEIASGKLDDAQVHSAMAVEVANQLVKLDPESTERSDRASFAHSVLGEAYFHLGQLEESRKSVAASIEIAQRLADLDETVQDWGGQYIARPKLKLARIEATTGRKQLASQLFGEIATSLHATVAANRAEPTTVRLYCEALAGRARLGPKFEEAWAEIILILGPSANKHGPEALGLLAEAYQRSDKPDEARPIIAKLYAAGYRHPDFMALLGEFPELKPAELADAAN